MNTSSFLYDPHKNELRGWGHDWLEGFRGIRQQQVDLGSYVPYPSHPLPVGFPWRLLAVAYIRMGPHERTGLFHRMERVDREDGTDLGVFEIAGPIYDTAVLPFTIDTDLVLEAMSASLRERMPVHLASRVVPVNVHPNELPRPLRIYELRTSDQTAIRTLGTRWEA
ncbi:hypothetical protein B0H13DRAFT_2673982 [Mycena leptocephala]|nr:hypothetical protein B0H13DRAFT_2673982 [Mycena leptocephala]